MPELAEKSTPASLKITPLHKTFGAEIEGLDLTDITNDGFQQVQDAIAKVSMSLVAYISK